MPDQNPLAFFPTSAETAKEMLKQLKRLLPIFPFCRTLEPSAGDGEIADEILSFSRINVQDISEQSEAYLQLIELDFSRSSGLKQKGYNVFQGDFLAMLPERTQSVFQAIAMNPPFAVAGKPKAYVDHITHAYAFWLEPGGALVAISPAGFAQNQDRKTSQFRELVESVGGWKYLEDDAFKHAGTGVKTIMLWMKKPQ